MNKAYSNLKPNISVESSPIYSSCFDLAGISPVSALDFSGLPEGRFNLSIEMNCKYGAYNIFSFTEKTFFDADTKMFDYSGEGRMIVKFTHKDFNIGSDFLKNNKDRISAEINVCVKVDENTYELALPIKILPGNEWHGLEFHPETLACFVTPDSNEVNSLIDGVQNLTGFASYEDAVGVVGTIVKNIRSKNIICARRDSYSPEKHQAVKTADELVSRSAVVATPLELVLLFSGCVYRCGLNPVIVFAKNTMGVVSVFCGVDLVTSAKTQVISESITRIRHSLENSEMILIDPAVMSSAEKSEVLYANNSASDYMHRINTEMYFSLNVAAAFDIGILPVNGKISYNNQNALQPREELAKIYTGLVNRPVFKMLGGEYGGYDVIPLIGADEEKITEKTYFVPLEISEKLDAFAGISDNFASFATREAKKKAYNKAELEQIMTMYVSFRHRIASKKNLVAGIYENSFHEKASRMAFGKARGMENYLICGFVKLTEGRTGETRYLPVSFSAIDLDYRYNYSFSKKPSRLIVNTVLASYLTNRDMDFLGTDTPEKALDIFEKLADSARKNKTDFSEITLIKEYALIKADLSDFVLWNDIRLYGKNMLTNRNFTSVISCEKQKNEDVSTDKDFVFPLFVPEKIKNVLNANENIIIYGDSVTEKTDVIINKVLKEITDSENVIVSSDNKAFLDEVYNAMDKNGFGETVLRLDDGITVPELSNCIREKLKEARKYTGQPSANILSEYEKIRTRINEFDTLLTKPDDDLGISFFDIMQSYLSAVNTQNESEKTVLEVEENAFSDMSQRKFNKLFEMAEKLVVSAVKAQETAELDKSVALEKNPMYPLNPSAMIQDGQIQDAFEIIDKILSVMSDYRETFYDISEDLGIDITDVKNLNGLYSLNELYKLIIFARELEIPDNFTGFNIAKAADSAEILQKSRQRLENIEYRLRFFSSEIFEDVESLLSGYNYSEHDQKGFIKKFIVRKNNKDILLQYVPSQNRAEFYQCDTEEIYKLLDEYRALKANISNNDETPLSDENGVKLALLVKDAQKLLAKIYPELLKNEALLNAKMNKIFRFIQKVSSDAAISKKLTYARAKLAQVYSENECLVSKLSELLSADFSGMMFEEGILGYHGFGEYLKTLEKNLPALATWLDWLEAKKEANAYIPTFSEYIIKNGVKDNTDRIFAVSLIIPAMKYVAEKHDIVKRKAMFDIAVSKYPELESSAKKMSALNVVSSYKHRLKHYAQLENLNNIEHDEHLSLSMFVNKYKKIILNIYPCILINSTDAGAFFGAERVADLLICDGSENENLGILSSVACANKVMMVNYNGDGGYLGRKLEKTNVTKARVSYHTHKAGRKLCSLYENGFFPGTLEDTSSVSLVTVNGTMRRVSDLANAAEAEICVAKALALAEKGEKSIAVFALTHGQYAYILHLLCLNSENNKIAADAIDNGVITVIDATEPCFEKYENVIVSLGAAADKNGNIGWNFGLGAVSKSAYVLMNMANSAVSDIVIVTSLTLKDIAKLSKTGSDAEKLYYTVLFASQGVLPVNASKFTEEDDILASKLLCDYPDVLRSAGRFESSCEAVSVYENKVYLLDFDGQTNIFDRLSVKKMFSDTQMECSDVSLVDNVLKNI